MKRFTFKNHPNYSVKKPKLLYIDRYGNIFPDCKTYKTPAICHINDDNTVKKIKSYFGPLADMPFNMITVEVSSACQARCLYCFQRDFHRNDKYQYYERLYHLLEQLETYWLFFSGGEILVQDDAMRFISEYREARPDTWIHLKTNGNAGDSAISFVSNTFNSVMVSFNGFSFSTYDTIMGLDIEKTKLFCEMIKNQGKTNLGLKLLNSPITIAETPEFLEWALSLEPKCIAIQVAYNYEVEPNGKSSRLSSTLPDKDFSLYWKDIYKVVSRRCDTVLTKYHDRINFGNNFLTADKEFLNLMSLSPENLNLFRTDGVYIIE